MKIREKRFLNMWYCHLIWIEKQKTNILLYIQFAYCAHDLFFNKSNNNSSIEKKSKETKLCLHFDELWKRKQEEESWIKTKKTMAVDIAIQTDAIRCRGNFIYCMKNDSVYVCIKKNKKNSLCLNNNKNLQIKQIS